MYVSIYIYIRVYICIELLQPANCIIISFVLGESSRFSAPRCPAVVDPKAPGLPAAQPGAPLGSLSAPARSAAWEKWGM